MQQPLKNVVQKKIPAAIIISVSSDIGAALAERWLSNGYQVAGTYRTDSQEIRKLERQGVNLVNCDLCDSNSVKLASNQLKTIFKRWDILIIASGSLDPVGPFMKNNFDSWEKSIHVNFINQLRIVHDLFESRNTLAEHGPCVLFFAGGGMNNTVINYSAYTASKIALIKMCELLDSEIPDTRFVIVGPGWVNTKIHESTLKAGPELAGFNYQRALKKQKESIYTTIEQVLDSCDWAIHSPRNTVSGRNFSTVFDNWGSAEFEEILSQDTNLFKLRRYGNDMLSLSRK